MIYRRARSLAQLLDDYYHGDILRDGYDLLRQLNAPMHYRNAADVARAQPLLRQALDLAWGLPHDQVTGGHAA